jgi:hypothetical protein
MKVVNYKVFALFLLISSIFVQNAYCYSYTITNETKSTILVTVRVALPIPGLEKMVEKEAIQLKKDETKELKFKGVQSGYCLYDVEVKYKDVNKTDGFVPGDFSGCGDYNLVIKEREKREFYAGESWGRILDNKKGGKEFFGNAI